MSFEVLVLDPAAQFIGSLPVKMRAKVYRTIDLLALFGHALPAPHAKPLKDARGLKELRVKLASDIVRLFYFHHEGCTYVVTSGYVKKTQKTSPQEIQRALRLMREFKGSAL